MQLGAAVFAAIVVVVVVDDDDALATSLSTFCPSVTGPSLLIPSSLVSLPLVPNFMLHYVFFVLAL